MRSSILEKAVVFFCMIFSANLCGADPTAQEAERLDTYNAEKCIGELKSAVEIRNVPISKLAIQALKNVLLDNGVANVQTTETYTSYNTELGDTVYFVTNARGLPSRVLVTSKCPVNDLGQIRRLDGALERAAHYYKAVQEGATDDDMIKLIAGRQGRIYYTQTAGKYNRFYLESVTKRKSTGFLNIPSGTRSTALVGANYGIRSGWKNAVDEFSIGGEPVCRRTDSGSQLYFVFWTGSLRVGQHAIIVTYHQDFNWPTDPGTRRIYFIDSAGEEMDGVQSVVVQGLAQPSLVSLPIDSLRLP